MMFLRPGARTGALLMLLLTPLYSQQTYTIETIAGHDFFNEGGNPTEARLNGPHGVAVRADGAVCFADNDHFRVRCVENGKISTIAGRGSLGFSGNNGPAQAAEFIEPQGIAYGPDGSLYIADAINYTIRRVAPDGTISIFAGTGVRGVSGEDGPATSARLAGPTNVTADSAGNVYIADTIADRVVVVGADGALRRFAGTGQTGNSGDGGRATSARLFDPAALAVAPGGAVYIADRSNHVIRRVDPDGIIRTVVGTGQEGSSGDGGSPLQARLREPRALALDADGKLYIGDANHRVRVVDFQAGVISAFAGNGDAVFTGPGAATSVALPNPTSLAVAPGGGVYISSRTAHRLFLARNGQLTVVAGRTHFSGDGAVATQAAFGRLEGIAANGSVWLADATNNRVRRIDGAGLIETVAGNGERESSGDGGPARSAGMRPVDVVPEPDGSLLILDQNGYVRRVRPGGTIQRIAGTGQVQIGSPAESVPATQASIVLPYRMDRDGEGNIYILQILPVSSLPFIVRRITPNGTIQTVLGGGNTLNEGALGLQAAIQFSSDLAVSEDGRVCFSDDFLFRVRCLGGDGQVRTVLGPGAAASLTPEGVAQTMPVFARGLAFASDGALLVADNAGQYIHRVAPSGEVTAIAGTGNTGFSGDGGPALSANLHQADGVTVDSEGRVLFVDRQNWRVRRLTPEDPAVLVSAVANAASFSGGPTAPGAIASLFGVELAGSTEIATELPLPATLGGVTVEVADSAGESRAARLFFVSPGQINLEIPEDTAPGPATLRVTAPAGIGELAVTIDAVAPGLFAINATGEGVAAAAAIRVAADGAQSVVDVFDATQSPIATAPIDLGPEDELVVLLLFGTGIRGAAAVEVTMNGEPAEVLGFLAQPDFIGLDQINAVIPRSLIGEGEVTVSVTVDGTNANEVTIDVE